MSNLIRSVTLMAVVATFMALVQAENCFYYNILTRTYDSKDPTGNYTCIREYWMRKDTVCTFVQDTKNKVDWYSSDITVRY